MTEKQIKEMLELVNEFYIKTGEEEYLFNKKISTLKESKKRKEMRKNIFLEELEEYFEKDLMKNELIIRLDAVTDMFYVAAGNVLEKSKSLENAYKIWTNGGIWETETAEILRKKSNFSQELILKSFKEVHRSNMTKITKDGKVLRREDGKVIKPDTFEEPNLEQFFKE